ncbi:MAG: hypothetical protein ACWA5X_11635 [bacterium]
MIIERKALVSEFVAIAELDRRVWISNGGGAFVADGEHVWRKWIDHSAVFCADEANQGVSSMNALSFPPGNHEIRGGCSRSRQPGTAVN